jgi:hypothetical protein
MADDILKIIYFSDTSREIVFSVVSILIKRNRLFFSNPTEIPGIAAVDCLMVHPLFIKSCLYFSKAFAVTFK